ncbi:MAG: glycogen synthase [Deltaproteobacteria bacterium]|nr:glycogen synthase [Deltaproteobacteria bacterium]
MHILMVTPEANPFAASGGLAEVIQGLSRALVNLGHQVTTVLPLYRQVRESGRELTPTGRTLTIPLSWKTLDAELFQASDDGVNYYFIAQDSLFNREGLYGTTYGSFEDNSERFIFFCRAVVEMQEALELEADVCHAHEWQTGLVPVYLRTLYHDRPRCRRLPVLYTVHNVGYQGIFSSFDLPLTGLGWELFSPKALEFYGRINFMKGGLVFADLLSTVSAKYREEIQTPEYGFGLEGLFQERASELFGIVEGVDYQWWNPSRCPYIAGQYDQENLEGKKACKAALLGQFNLALPLDRPLIGMTTRFFERKGIDLVENTLDELLQADVGFVIQGSGEERHEYLLREISQRHPDKMGLVVGYSYELAHRLIAGVDIFTMPSRYEPCGLDQLYCLRYGAIPVVRATGGLDETIQEYDPETGRGNGFKFTGYTPAEFLGALNRALTLYKNRPAWEALMRQNMTLDFSWETVAPKYVDLYQKVADKRQRLLAG